MNAFHYLSGEEVKVGDRVTYHGEPGRVLFVVAERTGDPAMDWYIDQYPGGGFMIDAKTFGHVFLTEPEEDLSLISPKGTR